MQRSSFWPIKIYSFFVIVYFSLSPLRTFGVYQALNITKISVVVTLVMSVFVWGWTSRKIYKDSMTVLLLFMLNVSVVIGLLRRNDMYYIVSDFFSLLAALCVYSFSGSLRINPINAKIVIGYVSSGLWFVSLAVVCVDYFFTYYMGIPSYLSYGESYMLLPFSYFLFNKKKFKVISLFFCIFLGGRVGVFLGCIAVCIAYFVMNSRTVSMKKLIFFSLFLFSCLNIVMYCVKDYSPEYGVALPIVNKLQNYNYFHFNESSQDLGQYGAGRMSEIEESFNAFSNLAFFPYILGGGSGFLYNLSVLDVVEATHNVHFSVLSIVEKYGFILAAMFYFYWIKILYINFEYYSLIKNLERKNIFGVMLAFCTGMFVFSFTAFTVFVELYPWFFLGFMNSFRNYRE